MPLVDRLSSMPKCLRVMVVGSTKSCSIFLVTGGPSILVYTTFVYLGGCSRGPLPSVAGSIAHIYSLASIAVAGVRYLLLPILCIRVYSYLATKVPHYASLL